MGHCFFLISDAKIVQTKEISKTKIDFLCFVFPGTVFFMKNIQNFRIDVLLVKKWN